MRFARERIQAMATTLNKKKSVILGILEKVNSATQELLSNQVSDFLFTWNPEIYSMTVANTMDEKVYKVSFNPFAAPLIVKVWVDDKRCETATETVAALTNLLLFLQSLQKAIKTENDPLLLDLLNYNLA